MPSRSSKTIKKKTPRIHSESLASYSWIYHLTVTVSHFRSSESIPPALSEKLTGVSIHFNSKPVFKVQFLNNDNSRVIGSIPERTHKGDRTAF